MMFQMLSFFLDCRQLPLHFFNLNFHITQLFFLKNVKVCDKMDYDQIKGNSRDSEYCWNTAVNVIQCQLGKFPFLFHTVVFASWVTEEAVNVTGFDFGSGRRKGRLNIA